MNLARVSQRALALTQLDTPMLGVLGGESDLHLLDGPNRTSGKKLRQSSSKLKQDQSIERADISTNTTDNAVSSRVQPTHAHSTRLVPHEESQPTSEGLARLASVQIG